MTVFILRICFLSIKIKHESTLLTMPASNSKFASPKSVWGATRLPDTLTPEEYTTLCETASAHPALTVFTSELLTTFRAFILSEMGHQLLRQGRLKFGTMKLGDYTLPDYKVRRFSPNKDNDKNGDTSLANLLSAFVLLANNENIWTTLTSQPDATTCWGDLTSFIETHIFPLIRAGDFRLAGALTVFYSILLGASRLEELEEITVESFDRFDVSYVRLAWTVHIQLSRNFLASSVSSVDGLHSLRTALSGRRTLQGSLPQHPDDGTVLILPPTYNEEKMRRDLHSFIRNAGDAFSVVEAAVRCIPTEEVKRTHAEASACHDEFRHLAAATQRHIDSLSLPTPAAAPATKAPPTHSCPECSKRFDNAFKMAQHRQSLHRIPIPQEVRQAQAEAQRAKVVPSLNHTMIQESV